jgi:hypothetical protein
VKILRLRCECGRNLADARKGWHEYADAPFEGGDGVWVKPRPGVDQSHHRVVPMLLDALTYRWACKCGRTPEVRHDRISAKWIEVVDDPRRVVAAVIGRDL